MQFNACKNKYLDALDPFDYLDHLPAMDVYADNILDHYRNPRGKEPLSSPTVSHHELNPSCGDEVTLELQLENDRVVAVGWNGEGCAISQASMSLLSEELIGKSPEELSSLTPQHIYDLLGVPVGPRRIKCALLSLHTLKNALRKAEGKDVQGWSETLA